ncbi:MAG TPA: hypothetical protein VMU16_08115 [Candidatus Binataceae bacterium]|nr:hypothetical protein [Candidatus Binataceae bacterium]
MEERQLSGVGIRPAIEGYFEIIEHELDMVRVVERRQPLTAWLSRIMRWLAPSGRRVGPPMRSVARELEEAYPSHEH